MKEDDGKTATGPGSPNSSPELNGIAPERFAILWRRLCAAYPREQFGPDTVKVYYDALKANPERALDRAIWRYIKEKPFFPSIAEILERVELPRKRREEPRPLDGAKIIELVKPLREKYEAFKNEPMRPKTPEELAARRAELERQKEKLLKEGK
jgi:hypothetical protein